MTIKRNSETDYTIKITREEINAIEDGLFYAWMHWLEKKVNCEKIQESSCIYKQFAEEKNQKVN